MEALDFGRRYLQPLDDPQRAAHTRECIDVCLQRPQWRLSTQTHKVIGIR